MLGSIEGTLAGVRLHPDDNVFEFGIRHRSGRKKLADVPPIDEYEMDGTVRRVPGGEGQRRAQEPGELRRRHFTGALGEVPMLYAPAALNLLDWQIIGRVGDDHRSGFSAHEAPKARGGKGVSAQELVRAELPQIAEFG